MLTVLIFHRVHREPELLFPDEPDASAFESRMCLVADLFNVLPLTEAIARLRTSSLPPRALAITFDDGYADNHDVALPILERLGLHATFFVSTGFLDGGRMWNDSVIETVRRCDGDALDASSIGAGTLPVNSIEARRQAIDVLIGKIKYLPLEQRLDVVARLAESARVTLPTDLMMSSAQVRGLHRAGMGIGAHTVNHPILARTEIDVARREIADGRDRLEAIIGERVALFAYPNGKPTVDYTADHVRIVRELGFEAAVATAWGAARHGDDLYQIPRFTPWNWTPWRATLLLARNLVRRPEVLAA